MGTSRSDLIGPWSAAALVPLACGPWLREQYLLPKLAVAALALPASAAWMSLRGGWALSSALDVPLAAFCGAAVLCAWRSIDPWLSWFGHDKEYLFSVTGLSGCTAAFYLGCALAAADASRKLAAWIVGGSLPVSLYGLLQVLGARLLPGPPLPEGRGALSSFGSPVYLGAYLAAVVPLVLFLRRDPARRRLALCALSLALGALALTASRGAWVSAAVGAGAFLAASGRLPRVRPRDRLSPPRLRPKIAALALALALALLALTRLRPGAVASDNARLGIWRVAWEEFLDRPWLGSGPDTFVIGFRRRKGEALSRIYGGFQVQSHAHDDWLEILATMGLVGAVAYAWLHARALKTLRARLPDAPFAAAAAGTLAAVLFFAKMNSPSFGAAWLAALVAGCALGRERKAAAAPLGAVLFVLASGWFCYASAVLVSADRQDWIGRAERAAGRPRDAAARFERAAALSPGTIAYRIDLANVLQDAAGALRGPDKRLLLDAAAAAAAGGVRARPLDAEAHRLLGVAELRRAQWGGEDTLPLARLSFENALKLDPFYVRTLADLSRVAELQGDQARGRELRERARRVWPWGLDEIP